MTHQNTLCALLLACVLTPLSAQTAARPEPIVVPEVDRRDIRTPRYPSNDFEIGLYAGSYATENFGASFVYGVRLGYHITEDFFVHATYAQTKVSDDSFRQILPGGVFENTKEKLTYYNLSAGYNVLPGEVFLFTKRAFPSQLYVLAGIGSTKFVDQRKSTINVGLGYRVFFNDHFAVSVDMRDHVFTLDLLGKKNSTNNLEFTAGVSAFF